MRIILARREYCLTCHQCALACSVNHTSSKDLLEALSSQERAAARIFIIGNEHQSGVVTCRHCLGAPCLKACPTQAIERDAFTGAVTIKEELCIGCRDCLLACPFGAITLEKGKAVKCDLCQGHPACVEACPTGALRFVDVEEESQSRRQKALTKLFPLRRKR